jgi:hypothetical protein
LGTKPTGSTVNKSYEKALARTENILIGSWFRAGWAFAGVGSGLDVSMTCSEGAAVKHPAHANDSKMNVRVFMAISLDGGFLDSR